MLLRCLNDYAFDRFGRNWKCEETQKSGDIYEVTDDLGKELLATGNFADALTGIAPEDFEAAMAELEKSYRIVSTGTPVSDEPDQPIASEPELEPEPEPETEPETEPDTESSEED